MTEQDDEPNPSIEERAVQFYVAHWYAPEPFSKYPNRWEKMRDCFENGDFVSLTEMLRMAMVQAYLAGVTLRLTEGEG